MSLKEQGIAMDIDLKSPDTHTKGLADSKFRELRQIEPVYWQNETDGPGFWSVTKYDDIVAISKNPTIFGSALDLGGFQIEDSRAFDADTGVNMITSDPPIHNHLRRAITPAFTPGKVRALEPTITQFVDDIIASIDGQLNVDFVETISARLSIDALCYVLGVAPGDRDKLVKWSDELIGFDDPEIRSDPEAINQSLKEMTWFALALWVRYSKKPDNSIISMLIRSKMPDGELLSMKDFIATFILIIVAGNETTRSAISGGIVALHNHPDQLTMLKKQPHLIDSAINELLRWVTPIIYMRRTAKSDISLRGKSIKKGDKVVMWYTSANRDEDKFDNPYTFNIKRKGAAHLSFGSGNHFCIGSKLAELQMRLLFTKLLKKYPDMELLGEGVKIRSNFINGYKSLPVRLCAELVT